MNGFSISGLEIIVGLGMAIFTIVIARIEIVRTRRTRTNDLYAEFYAAEHYRKVVMPVYRIIIKLGALEGRDRTEYIDAIVAGWAHDPEAAPLADAMTTEGEARLGAFEQHFLFEHSTEAFTEHEALTSFVYFWVRAHRMLETRLIDKRLFQRLFCNSFAYYDDFLIEMRREIGRVAGPGEEPSWVDATAEMQELLGNAAC